MALFLVTGGAGFIGSNLVRKLLEDSHSVRVIDDFSTGRRENLKGLEASIELIEGSICEPSLAARAVAGANFVLHQAAIPSVPRSLEDPLATHHAAVTGTVNLLVACRKFPVKRFVYAGSSSIYGETPTLPKVETMNPSPMSPYAASKLAGEYYCKVFYEVFSVPTVILRYFNVFGPRQDPESLYAAVIPRFIGALLRGESPVIFGDGEQTRDFTYVDDVVRANLLACSQDEALGEVMNISAGRAVQVNQLLKTLGKILGRSASPIYAPPRPGDVRHSYADVTKACQLIGFEAKFTLEEGLEKTVAWFRRAQ